MKHLKLLVLACLLTPSGFAYGVDDDYCDGFRKGFTQRYCLLLGKTVMDALPPVCPDPVLGADSTQDGYNRGFLVGLNAAQLCEEGVEGESDERPRPPGISSPPDLGLQR